MAAGFVVKARNPAGTVRSTLDARGATAGRRFSEKMPLLTEGGIAVQGYMPVLLITVKTGSTKHRRAFGRFCRFNGLIAQVAHKVCADGKNGYTTVYEVTGGLALEELTTLDCVAGWVCALNVGAPRFRSSKTAPPNYRRK